MQAHQSCKIWTISDDEKEYDRYSYLLEKPDCKGISVEEVNKILLEKSLSSFVGEPYVVIIHDESNIRKPNSKKMEGLGKVKALGGGLVNGYHTFNSVALGADKIHLLSCVPYGTEEESYNKDFNGKSILMNQLHEISIGFKSQNPDVVLVHVIDKGEDDQAVFDYIDKTLNDKFVIRAKMNRNSCLMGWSEEKGREMAVKIAQIPMRNNFEQVYEVFSWKGKTFKNAKAKIAYEHCYLGSNQYYIVKIQMYDSANRKIFKDPMLLATNLELSSEEVALRTFHLYLKRSKIEGVFKFLKDELGWEEFQVQSLLAIKHILILCYFVGAYFCELEPRIVDNEFMRLICKLGGGKDKVTLHFFLIGIQKLHAYEVTARFFKEEQLSKKEINQLLKFIK